VSNTKKSTFITKWNNFQLETRDRFLFRVADSNVNMSDILNAVGYSSDKKQRYILQKRIIFYVERSGREYRRWVDLKTAVRVCEDILPDLLDPLRMLGEGKISFWMEMAQAQAGNDKARKQARRGIGEMVFRLEDGRLVSFGGAQTTSVRMTAVAGRPAEDNMDEPGDPLLGAAADGYRYSFIPQVSTLLPMTHPDYMHKSTSDAYSWSNSSDWKDDSWVPG
jgi:hypothetical protein